MKIRFFIDVSRLLDRAGGVRRYTGVDRVCLAYLDRWGQHSRAVVIHRGWRRIFGVKTSQRLFPQLSQPARGAFWTHRRILLQGCIPPWPAQNGQGVFTIFTAHQGLEKPGFERWIRDTDQRPIYFIHDLIPITHPEFCRAGERELHEQRLAVAMRSGAGLIVNSEHTLTEIRRWASGMQLKVPPTVVAPLAPLTLGSSMTVVGSRGVMPDPRPPIPGPYFVVLATIEPRKNHLLLLNVWRALVAKHGAATPKLVIIGQRGWECENIIDVLDRCSALKPHLIEIGQAGDVEVARILRFAKALLFPSFAEGFGLPLVEALSAGTPVVASDLPVFKEVAGQTCEFLSPIDGLGWMKAVEDYAAPNSVRRAHQLQRLSSWTCPTWQRHFDLVEAWLKDIR